MENMEEIEIEEVKVEKVKKKSKNGKWINILSNIFFIPVMIILVVYLMYAISVQKDNGVPTFFGQGYVKVLSNSMKASGFEKGDVVVIQKVNISSIKKADANEQNGSIIAFYNSTDTPLASKYNMFTEKQISTKDFKTGETTKQSAILFHQVIGIYYDNVGNTWFETKGTSNNTADSYLVRGDYVIGQYKASPLAGIIQFISSTNGMIVLIIVPSCVLLFMLLLNIIEIIDQMMREKKEKPALVGDLKERELNITTLIEEDGEVHEEKPVKRTRRSRKNAESQEAVAETSEAEEKVEAPVVEEKVETPVVEEKVEAATVKPTRRRAVAQTQEVSAVEEKTEEPQPVRRRRAVAQPVVEEVQETPAVEEKPTTRRRRAVENLVQEAEVENKEAEKPTARRHRVAVQPVEEVAEAPAVEKPARKRAVTPAVEEKVETPVVENDGEGAAARRRRRRLQESSDDENE